MPQLTVISKDHPAPRKRAEETLLCPVMLCSLFMLSGCVWPIVPHPGSEREAAERAEYSRHQQDEQDKMSRKYVGMDKDEILKACGEPDTKRGKPRYKEAVYDEVWEYKGGCGMKLLPGYETLTLYFINYQVAEVGFYL